jgi:hypothetical protein
MPDNILEIAVTAVLDQLEAGMSEAVSVVEGAADSMKVSFGQVGAASAAMEAEAAESMTAMKEQFVSAAETAKISAEGIGSAFSGIGSLLGAGIAVGLFLHVTDETEKFVLELGRLSDQTGIDISALAGLREVAEQTGTSFGSVETALVRMLRAQDLAIAGHKAQKDAFEQIGISVNDLKSLSPEDLFFQVAEGLNQTDSASEAAATAITLFGKGGAALIPMLREYGDNLRVLVDEHGKASLVTREAYDSALQYQTVTANLGATIRSVTIPAMEILTKTLIFLENAFAVAKAAFQEFALEGAVAFQNIGRYVSGLGTAVEELTVGNVRAAVQAMKDADAAVQLSNKIAADQIEGMWANATDSILKNMEKVKAPLPAIEAPEAPPKEKTDHQVFEERKKLWEDDLNILKTTHLLEAGEEHDFWISKMLPYAKEGSEYYHEVLKEMGSWNQEIQKTREEQAKQAFKAEEEEYKQLATEFKKYQDDIIKSATATQLYRLKLLKEEQKEIIAEEKKTAKERERIENEMERNFSKNIDQMIFQSKSFGDAMLKLWMDIEKAFITSLLRMLAQHIAHQIAKLGATTAEQEGEVAVTATASAQKRGIDFIDTIKSITNSAVSAAGKAYDAVVGIPYIGPVLAPVAAAVAFTGVEAFGAIASAEGGWDVPQDALALIHKNEMVLPAPLADTVRGRASSDASTGGDTNHLHIHQSVTAMDTAGFEAVMKRNRAAHAKEVHAALRSGHLNLKGAI